jgi:hypothetical protein
MSSFDKGQSIRISYEDETLHPRNPLCPALAKSVYIPNQRFRFICILEFPFCRTDPVKALGVVHS